MHQFSHDGHATRRAALNSVIAALFLVGVKLGVGLATNSWASCPRPRTAALTSSPQA